jgi:hypothetical protein
MCKSQIAFPPGEVILSQKAGVAKCLRQVPDGCPLGGPVLEKDSASRGQTLLCPAENAVVKLQSVLFCQQCLAGFIIANPGFQRGKLFL